jgi:RNA polymerase sigma factor (sigma-70 family)
MEKEYDSLSTYITLAKKIISKFAPGFYSSLRQELLSNEDAIADIASAIMIGDWRWDKDRVGFEGKSKTKYSYRNQCGIWAIKTYLSNKYRKQNNHYSLDNLNKDLDTTFTENIEDKPEYEPSLIAEQNENEEILKNSIESILSCGIISEKQKEQIKQYYFEDKTLSEIGESFGVTREAIRQNIQKGLSKIREYA